MRRPFSASGTTASPSRERTNTFIPIDQGFDEFFGYTDAVHAWEKFPTKLWDGREQVPVSGYIDDLITDRGIEFVGGTRRSRSFCTSLTWPRISGSPRRPTRCRDIKAGLPETDPSLPLKATYAAMVTRLDGNIGRLLETLRATRFDA